MEYKDNVIRNNSIYALDFGGKRIDTSKGLKAGVQFSPRVGFTWSFNEEQLMKLRGGTGIFLGRLPLVFFTNMPTYSGLLQGSIALQTKYDAKGEILTSDPRLTQLAGKPMITDVDKMVKTLGLQNAVTPYKGALPSEINSVDPGFKMPQVWKTSLAFDFELPVSYPFVITLEGIYTKTLNGIMLKNYDLKEPDSTWKRFEGSDNRYIYPESNAIRYHGKDAYVLSNTNKGWGVVGNITIEAEPIKNLKLMTAYTFTESKEIIGMPGSNASSAYGSILGINGAHLPKLERSQYVIPHKVIGSASFKKPWIIGDLESAAFISLFYSGGSTYVNSYTYTNDMNNDGRNTDLIYIPKRKGDINFVSVEDENAFFAFVNQDNYLRNNKGKYAGANAVYNPWVHKFDLRLAYEYYLKIGGNINIFQINIDILNVGNLLNTKWGIPKRMDVSNGGKILRYEGVNSKNEPVFSFPKVENEKREAVYITNTYNYDYYLSETWEIQIGVKYMF